MEEKEVCCCKCQNLSQKEQVFIFSVAYQLAKKNGEAISEQVEQVIKAKQRVDSLGLGKVDHVHL